MRFTVALFSIVCVLFAFERGGAQQTVTKRREGPRVEFYVAGRFPFSALNYRMRWFRLVGKNSPELAGRFHGLSAEGLESGEYEYVLTPDNPPAGLHKADLAIAGKAPLYGPYSYWITLQTPTGSIADGENMFPLSGRVMGAPSGGTEPLWIRFQHVVEHSQGIQAKLRGDGIFQVTNNIPFAGSVIVTICKGADVLYLEVVHFTGGRPEHPLDFKLRKTPL